MASGAPRQQSSHQYYIDHYDKCENCGKLLYGDGFTARVDDKDRLFCSEWCLDWYRQRRSRQARAVEGA